MLVFFCLWFILLLFYFNLLQFSVLSRLCIGQGAKGRSEKVKVRRTQTKKPRNQSAELRKGTSKLN